MAEPQALGTGLMLVLNVAVGGALFVYVLYLLVLAARKAGRTGTGGAVVGIFVMLFGPNIAPPPPHEAAAEEREEKRNEDDGDPPELGSSLRAKGLCAAGESRSSELTETTGRKMK